MEESAMTRNTRAWQPCGSFAGGNDIGHHKRPDDPGDPASRATVASISDNESGSRPTAISMARDHRRISAERETIVITVSGGGLVWPSMEARTERRRRAMHGTPRGNCRRIFAARVGSATTSARPAADLSSEESKSVAAMGTRQRFRELRLKNFAHGRFRLRDQNALVGNRMNHVFQPVQHFFGLVVLTAGGLQQRGQ